MRIARPPPRQTIESEVIQLADDKLKQISILIAERDEIDADIERIAALRERRKVVNAALSQLMGLAEPKKRGRPAKQPELPM